MRRWIRSLRGERIALTGALWLPRAEVQDQVRQRGGFSVGANVTGDTTVLVKGESERWKYGDYGIKERRAAQLIRKGVFISLLNEAEFRKLMEKRKPARVADRVAGQPVQWLAPATERQFQRAANKEGPLDREHSAFGRVEQGYLRSILFGNFEHAKCSFCGRRLPVGLLVAAHLKARSECTRRERLDAENIVIPMCLLGCDVLYERGLITVDGRGRILCSDAQPFPALNAVLRGLRKRKCSGWKKARAEYFKWHLTQRYQGHAAAV